MSKLNGLARVAVFGILLGAPTAYSAALAPGGLLIGLSDIGGTLGAQVGATQVSPTGIFGLNSSGTLTSGVFTDTATSNLDFVYQYTLTSGDLASLSLSQNGAFGAFTTDVGLDTSQAVAGFNVASTNGPFTVTRGLGALQGILNFTWTPATLTDTATLIIKTNATTAELSQIGVIEGGATNVAGWTPAPEPAQVSLALGGLFGVALLVTRKFRARLN